MSNQAQGTQSIVDALNRPSPHMAHKARLLMADAAHELELLYNVLKEYRAAEWMVTPASSQDRDRILDMVDTALRVTPEVSNDRE